MFVVLAVDKLPPDMVMYFTVVLLVPTGIITVKEALAGFSNEGMITVMTLFIISAGVEHSGALEYVKRLLFWRYTKAEPLPATLLRICVLLGFLSAFLNNTPIVAIFIPLLDEFCRKNGLAPSRVMLPMSYAVILGGTITLIGTSTNLVAKGLVEDHVPDFKIGLFDMARIGVPVWIAGSLYIMAFAGVLLPAKGKSRTLDVLDDPREYIVSVRVDKGSPLAGHTIAQNGLRSLKDLFVVDIVRADLNIPAPAPDTVLAEDDHLVLAGAVDTVLELVTRTRGLSLLEDLHHEDLAKIRGSRTLVEAIVGNHASLVGHSVKELAFRSRYEAAIIAVHRSGERVNQSIGDIVLRAGDALLLVTGPAFLNSFRHASSSVFVLVQPLGEYSSIKVNYKAPLALFIILAVVVASAAADYSLLTIAFFGVAAMMATGIVDQRAAHKSINLEVLIMIAAGFALSTALTNSGAAALVANALMDAARPGGDLALIVMFYVIAVVFNAVVTNNAAVAIMFPIALTIYESGALDIYTLIYVLMFAGSADFSTPIGYQTNLMVMAPGGYRFLDYTRFGLPLQVVAGFFCVLVAMRMDIWWVVTLVMLLVAALGLGAAFVWHRNRRWVVDRFAFFRAKRAASFDDGDDGADEASASPDKTEMAERGGGSAQYP